MVKYLITDIWWDVDEDEEFDSLPQRITVKVSKDKDIDDIEEYLSEMITDKYGFCHNGFAYDEI